MKGAEFDPQSTFLCLLIGLCGGQRFIYIGSSDGKASACNVGDLGLISGSGRFPGEENGNLLQYSCMENAKDRRAWRATVYGVAKSRTRLSNFHFTSSLQIYVCVCVCVCVCVYKALWNDLEPYWIIRATYNKAQWRTEVEVTSSGNPLYNPRGCQYSDCVLQQHSRWCTLSLRRPPSTGRGSINEAEWVNEVDAGKQNFILMPYSAYLMGSDDPQFQHYQNQ